MGHVSVGNIDDESCNWDRIGLLASRRPDPKNLYRQIACATDAWATKK